MRMRRIIPWLAVVWVAILTPSGCQPGAERKAQDPPLKISLALAPFPYSGLIAIADEKGFFKESGIEVSVKEYAYGFATLEALSRGETQVAMGNDLVFAQKISRDPSLRIVASIALADTNGIVARRDRDIHKPSDLKGKRIGIVPNTSSEYYFTTFLLVNKILGAEVTAVSVPPDRIVEAIVRGEVDAISSWDTDVYQAKKRLRENAVSWPSQNNRNWHWILAVRESMTQSPEPIKRFLRALVKAEDFLLAHEEEAKDIIMHKWGFDQEFIRQVWDKTRLNVTLSQSLIVSLESFARWRMAKEAKHGDPPNFLNYIYTGALDEIDPKAVTIFR